MLRRASVLLGLAVLLSLLFPVQALLKEGGIEPSTVGLAGIDLAGVCALVAVLPALLLARDANLALRVPRWNPWIALLALFSLLFLLLHVSWAEELAGAWLREAITQGNVPVRVSEHAVLAGAELAARLGVLVCVVGVLVNLQGVPDEDAAAAPRRRKG
jgi:hypothetical protein